MTAPTDRDLILRAHRGESEAFGELVTRYQAGVFSVCYRILHERGETEGMAAFHADMQEHMSQLTIVTMSEFGRRASENGSLGTDHGYGSMMVVMGGNVIGGRVHGE